MLFGERFKCLEPEKINCTNDELYHRNFPVAFPGKITMHLLVIQYSFWAQLATEVLLSQLIKMCASLDLEDAIADLSRKIFRNGSLF